MDADRDAAAGNAGGDDRDEAVCRGASCYRERNCYYAGYRYGLSRRWNAGNRDCDCKLAGVYYCERAGGTEREYVGDDYSRGFEFATGSECGIDADGDLLHGGASGRGWECEPGVLGGSGEPVSGAGERDSEYGSADFGGYAD